MNNLEHLLEKYWNGETSLEEEKNIQQHLDNNGDNENASFFRALKEEHSIKSTLTEEVFLDALNKDQLLDKYWNGETSLEEEKSIQQHLDNNSDHEDASFFHALKEERNIKSTLTEETFLNALNKDQLLDKYWNGETSLEEEKSIQQYLDNNIDHEDATFFSTLKEERNIKSSMTEEKFLASLTSTNESQKTKTFTLRPLLKYAAILILPIALFFSINIFKMSESSNGLAYNETDQNVVKQRVIEDPQEAYRLTMDALMFASKKLNKAEMQVKSNMPLLNKTRIIK